MNTIFESVREIIFHNHNDLDQSIHSVKQMTEILARERARSDRNNHRFALILFEIDMTDHHENARNLIRIITGRVRDTDEVGWIAHNLIGIILPETSTKGALKVAESIQSFLDNKDNIFKITVLTYPSSKWKEFAPLQESKQAE
jgi:hypothetical protein